MTGRARQAAQLAAALLPGAPLTGALLTGALLTGALLAGCGVGPEGTARPLRPQQAPRGVLSTPSPDSPLVGSGSETLLFVRDSHLVPVQRRTQDSTAGAVLDDLLQGPLPAERAAGLTTALPSTAGPVPVVLRDGIATVALPGGLLNSGRSDQVLALGQLVVTLDGLPDVVGVRFEQDGEPLPVPRGDGAVVPGPVTGADYQELLARG